MPTRFPPKQIHVSNWLLSGAVFVFLLILTGCGLKHSAPSDSNKGLIRQFRLGFYEEGIASWYGHPFHGCPTASGEIYNMHALTAAHKELPLGSRILVRNLENQHQVEVLINDRGPFIKNRILDLSLAAARQLDLEKNGTAQVRISVLELPASISSSSEKPYALQFGAFKNRDHALALRNQIATLNPAVFLEEFRIDKEILYRVRLGWFSSRDLAYREATRLGFSEAQIFRR
ncbi:MAG TPA: septal ring lytic transglycosylase RlpA family protein [Proteobacteria bacterium]|nr:septal ring lytic transglycosylase RlpA family protein [Pseudomonadota bacterium]